MYSSCGLQPEHLPGSKRGPVSKVRWRDIEADVEREEKRNRFKRRKSRRYPHTQRERETDTQRILKWRMWKKKEERSKRTAGGTTHTPNWWSRIIRLWMLLLLLLHMNNFPVLHNDATRQVSSVLAMQSYTLSLIYRLLYSTVQM